MSLNLEPEVLLALLAAAVILQWMKLTFRKEPRVQKESRPDRKRKQPNPADEQPFRPSDYAYVGTAGKLVGVINKLAPPLAANAGQGTLNAALGLDSEQRASGVASGAASGVAGDVSLSLPDAVRQRTDRG